MSSQQPQIFRQIASKPPTELSRYERLNRPPRKVAKEKCDNCRKGKSKCVPQDQGCLRCFQKGLHCPGLTKAKPVKPRSSVSAELSPSSATMTPSVVSMSFKPPEPVLGELQALQNTLDPQREMEISKWVEGATPAFSRLLAMEELRGLEIGLDYLDRSNRGYAESIDSDEETTGADETIWTPVASDCASNDTRVDLFDEPARTTPNFITYLKSLSPTKSGHVKCRFCDWNFDRDLELDEVRNHFRDCNWKYPNLTGENAEDNELQEIIDKLRSRCLDIQANREQLRVAALARLPSVDGFLNQVRIFCDGRLACIEPNCKGARFFDASWGHLKSHYEDYHTDGLLRDQETRDVLNVDDHLAGYQGDITELFVKAQNQKAGWASMHHDAREMEKERCRQSLELELSAYRRLPEMPQFGVVKDLDKVFRSRYRQFCRFIAKSPSTDLALFANELREKCPKPKDLRRLGTRTFERVLQGSSPTTLLEIFAFIDLSQAMATVMERRGIHVDLNPGTIDYHAWRACIKDEADQRLYDQILIAWFHPRWREELHSSGTNQTSLSAQEAMENLVLQLMQAKQTNGAFKFSAFLRLDSFPKKQTHRGPRTLWSDDCQPFGSPLETYPNKEEQLDPGGSGTEALINTVIFIGVWLFMIYISALGVVLLYLSNPEQRCHLITRDGEEHAASARNVLLAAQKMKDKILDRLRQHSSIVPLKGIVEGVEEVLNGGYVWSVSDLHVCLEQAVQNHVEEPDLRSLLYTKIRHWCKEALNSVEPICENHRGGCMFVPVAP